MFAVFTTKVVGLLSSNPMVIRRLAIAIPSAAAGSYAVVADEPKQFVYTVSSVPVRLARDAWTAGAILADYKYTLWGLEGHQMQQAKEECHTRGANRLLKLGQQNGGVYIKLCQHIGMLDHVLPAAYVTTMRENMLDRCPVSPWSSVRATIIEDFGAPPEALFAEIEQEPVASASLAQVHVARDHDGRKLAVKVQHRGLRETSNVDLKTIEFLVRAVKFFSPTFDYMWLVDEANHNLPCELDFLHEADNSDRCASNLTSSKSRVSSRVALPTIDRTRTSHRVLTMDFIEGVKVTDLEGLKRIGASPQAVAKLISETFNEMIFTHGYVHADPHAANLLIAPIASTKNDNTSNNAGQGWQLVLLDHGLYRELDDDFRLEYAALWRALVFADVEAIKKHSEAMHAGDSVPIFTGMLTQRPWHEVTKKGSVDRLNLKYTEEERAEIQQYAGQYLQEITDLLGRMPRELLLLLKTNDCLRSVDLELGAGVNNYVITARECARALADHKVAQRPSSRRTRFVAAMDRVQVELRMLGLRLMTVLAPLEVWLEYVTRSRKQQQGRGNAMQSESQPILAAA